MNFVRWLLDGSVFITRDHCGAWTPGLIGINQLTNFMIAMAYFAIPIALLVVWFRMYVPGAKKIVRQHPWMILLFVIFIFSCGLGHLNDVIVFWWAPYRLFTFINLLTAVSSVITAMLLPAVIYDYLKEISDECEEE